MHLHSSSLILALLSCVLLCCPWSALAQEPTSRAETDARRQQEKARNLSTEKPGLLERQLLSIERAGGFAVRRGVFVSAGGIKAGSGFALGPAYGKTFSSGAVFLANGSYSVRQFKLAQVALFGPPHLGDRFRWSTRARWQDAPAGAVYPLGPDSRQIRADYAEQKTELSATATLKPVRWLQFNGGTGVELFKTGPPNSKLPSVEVLTPGLPGLFADPHYLHSQISAALDSRQGYSYSRRGSLLRAILHDYQQTNERLGNAGSFTFRRVDAVAEQYVPILHGNWVLYFGARASTTDPGPGARVPFFLMPDLGGNDLRGYANYRFRDRHSLLLTAEYRWYAQEFLDAAIFYDAGKVVPHRGDLDFSHLKNNVGFGVRLHTTQATLIRLELARSREGLRFIFAFSGIGG